MPTTDLKTGDFVTYEDIANPPTEYLVTAVTDDPWATYELQNVETGEFATSDCKQYGWNKVTAEQSKVVAIFEKQDRVYALATKLLKLGFTAEAILAKVAEDTNVPGTFRVAVLRAEHDFTKAG